MRDEDDRPSSPPGYVEKDPFLHSKPKLHLTDILRDNPPDPWGRGHKELYAICGLLYFNSMMAGFDGSLLGNINALSEFSSYFGFDGTGVGLGFLFAAVQVGAMIGAFLLWVADWRGRLFCIQAGSFGVLCTIVIQGMCTTFGMFVFGRCVMGIFSSIACKGSAMYLIEIAPPKYRGFLGGLYNTLYYCGSLLATSSTVISQKQYGGTEYAWRMPVWYQSIPPSIVFIGAFFIPESPRWLMAKNRKDEARNILTRFHANGDTMHPIVELEMTEMSEDLQAAGGPMTAKSYFDWSNMVRTKGRRYRIFVLVCMSWFGQFSGNNLVSYFLPQMLTNVGITSVDTKLLLNGLYAVVAWMAAASGAALHDVFGRRLVTCTSGLAICMSIITTTSAAYEYTGSGFLSMLTIFWIYTFGIVYSLGYTSMQPIYPAEVLTNDMRAKGLSISMFTAGCAGFVNTFAAPVAMARFGYWFYLFFVFWDTLEASVIYKYFVETKGRTLEELDDVFESPNPAIASMITRKGREA